MLQQITTVTYRTHDLAASRNAVAEYFGYRVIAEGDVENILCSAWNAPNVLSRPYCVMQPRSGEQFYLRFIQYDADESYQPLMSYGWNATELLLGNVESTAAMLNESPFQIIGGPRDLMNNGAAIALQVKGPADELFYLTQISGATMQASYGAAKCAVDKAFIVVLGAKDLQATREFYRPLVSGMSRPRSFAIRVLSAAHGVNADTRYAICGATLGEQNRIEFDAYPATAVDRHTPEGAIPPGISMVSFVVDSLDTWSSDLPIHVAPDIPPYFGCRFVRIIGPDNEWLELLESPGHR